MTRLLRVFPAILALLATLAFPLLPSPAAAAGDPLRPFRELTQGDWEKTVRDADYAVICWYHEMKDRPILGGRRPSRMAADYLDALQAVVPEGMPRPIPVYRVNLRYLSLRGERDFAAHLSFGKGQEDWIPVIVQYEKGRAMRIAYLDRKRDRMSLGPADFFSQPVRWWILREEKKRQGAF